MFKTCYSARYFHFFLTFLIHYFSSVSYAIGGGGGGGRGLEVWTPLLPTPPPPLLSPAQVKVLPDLGSLIFIRFFVSFFVFKVRIFLLKRFRAMYTAGYMNNELLLLLLLTGVLHLVLFGIHL